VFYYCDCILSSRCISCVEAQLSYLSMKMANSGSLHSLLFFYSQPESLC